MIDAVKIITIDGPSGTGKGTLCHLVANHLKWHSLDSGCLYRVLAFAARARGITTEDGPELIDLAHTLVVAFEPTSSSSTGAIVFEGQNIADAIRAEWCGQEASMIAAYSAVRDALLVKQRAFARPPGLVADGRDMGTVVFPNAILKIYLDASSEERGLRRYNQLQERGINASLPEVISELTARDVRDTKRCNAPLIPAMDAVIINTTGLTIAQVFESVLKLIKKVIDY